MIEIYLDQRLNPAPHPSMHESFRALINEIATQNLNYYSNNSLV
jgi:hypothetical protein